MLEVEIHQTRGRPRARTAAVEQNHGALDGKRRDTGATNRGEESVDFCFSRLGTPARSFGNASTGAHQVDRLDRLHKKVSGPHLQQSARDIFIECLRYRDDRRPRANPRHQPRECGHLIGASGVKIDNDYGRVSDIERIALLSKAA